MLGAWCLVFTAVESTNHPTTTANKCTIIDGKDSLKNCTIKNLYTNGHTRPQRNFTKLLTIFIRYHIEHIRVDLGNDDNNTEKRAK